MKRPDWKIFGDINANVGVMNKPCQYDKNVWLELDCCDFNGDPFCSYNDWSHQELQTKDFKSADSITIAQTSRDKKHAYTYSTCTCTHTYNALTHKNAGTTFLIRKGGKKYKDEKKSINQSRQTHSLSAFENMQIQTHHSFIVPTCLVFSDEEETKALAWRTKAWDCHTTTHPYMTRLGQILLSRQSFCDRCYTVSVVINTGWNTAYLSEKVGRNSVMRIIQSKVL